MFTLNINQNSKPQMVFTSIITVLAILTLGMIKFSATPKADHSYDAVERMHASRSFTYAPKLASYDQIEKVRAQRALNLTADNYNPLEQLRTARGLSADRAYDKVENARALRNNGLAIAFAYDQIESLRIQRGVGPLAIASAYDLIEQVRLGRAFNADQSYDKIESLRLHR